MQWGRGKLGAGRGNGNGGDGLKWVVWRKALGVGGLEKEGMKEGSGDGTVGRGAVG